MTRMSVLDNTAFIDALRHLDRKATRAADRWDLLPPGHDLLVGVSGGKDSLVLLSVLAARRTWRKDTYDLAACFVKEDYCEPDCSYSHTLKNLCRELGVELIVVAGASGGTGEAASGDAGEAEHSAILKSPCFTCARRRRQALLRAADRAGAEVIALGHHKDDLAANVILNLFHHGRLEGLQPRRDLFQGRFRLVRPLILVDEDDIVRAARTGGLPLHGCLCPHAASGMRAQAEQVVRTARVNGFPKVTDGLLRATLGGRPRPGRQTPNR